jgi:hypothetical protein
MVVTNDKSNPDIMKDEIVCGNFLFQYLTMIVIIFMAGDKIDEFVTFYLDK